jgi:hypothetical protein
MREKLSAAALIKTRTWSTDEVRQMMNEAVAAEREACAQFVENFGSWPRTVFENVAAAIRARG